MTRSSFPESFAKLEAWSREHGVSLEEGRRRFAQFCVLGSVGSSKILSGVLVFKGGNALDFFWHPNRSTMDLDFSVTGSEADQPDFQALFSSGLSVVQQEMGVSLRLQSAERRPPSRERTWATWQLKVAYALPDDARNRGQIERREPISNVVPVEISLNEIVCAVEDLALADRPFRLHVCTLEDIVAEKLRALLQQIPRNRRRGQDLLDIASVLQADAPLSATRVAHFLQAKARAREIVVSKSAFREPELALRASHDYERLEDSTRSSFIPFDEALATVLGFVERLPIPE